MESIVDVGLRNALFALPFAAAALFAGRLFRRPALTHALWLLVLLRLLLPPLWSVAVPKPAALSSPAIVAEAPESSSTEYPVSGVEPASTNVADSESGAPLTPQRGDD